MFLLGHEIHLNDMHKAFNLRFDLCWTRGMFIHVATRSFVGSHEQLFEISGKNVYVLAPNISSAWSQALCEKPMSDLMGCMAPQ